MNPVTDSAILEAGRVAGIGKESLIIDAGAGNGTALILLADTYGCAGSGIDIREDACKAATAAAARAGLSDRLEFICGDAATAAIPEEPDLVIALGSVDCWGGPDEAISACAEIAGKNGSILFGDRVWKGTCTPPEFAREWPEVRTLYELITAGREAGLKPVWLWHATPADWDRYESGIWTHTAAWLREQPEAPESDELAAYFEAIQDEYILFGRDSIGWAMILFSPA
ncbi:class I SAM-dependent methyltransferase [Methanogenium marinum]|uniref:Class I SAM-dependent methyltransferase n=1 Tax=Methanogenium marinum TaxID=348610 RepID=A0A9Q4PYD8_9EURY|nr:class I SAM-dependent methyltransferase [Methanogenium marinum]MDE4908503.1 class I SAM-dependent methyltransferase [Methanogenium marinum]